MHLIKYNSEQVSNAYMFRHWGALLRESSITKEYNTYVLIDVWDD